MKYLFIFSPLFCQAQVTLDTNHVSTANQTYIYAVECKEIKDDLFIQLDSAISLIEQQREQIERYDTLSVIADVKYSICEEDAANAKKQAKKEHIKRKVNGTLLWIATGAAAIFAALYFLR